MAGLFINSKKQFGLYNNLDPRGKTFPDAREPDAANRSENEQFLKSMHLKISPQILFDKFEYLTENEKEKIFNGHPIIKKLLDDIRVLSDEVNKTQYPLSLTAEQRQEQYNRGQNIIESRKTNLSPGEQSELDIVVKEYISQFTPFTDGQSAWDMIIALGKYHHLPVYNLEGELLWPKHMSHEEVEKMVKEKTQDTAVGH